MIRKCNRCEQEIAFLKTASGKTMPVDAESLSEEDVELINRGDQPEFRYNDHVSHFATCPAAAEFRRPKNAKS